VALPDGKLLWQVMTPAERRHYNCATPIVDDRTVIYTGQGTGTKAIEIQKQGEAFTAKELWSNEEIGTAFNTPVLKDGLLFGLSDRSTFYCMNARSGQVAWSDTTKHDIFGSVLDAGSVLLALTPQSELFAFQPDGKKYTELARIKIADTPTYAHPVISGNRIYTKDDEMLTLWMLQ
jgi:outer membrane protein assembly factor BamB